MEGALVSSLTPAFEQHSSYKLAEVSTCVKISYACVDYPGMGSVSLTLKANGCQRAGPRCCGC